MLDIDEAIDHPATAARLRFLEPGLPLRISDLRDTLGGYACSVVEVEGRLIWVDLPIRRDGMLELAPGQLVSVRFDRPGDAVYSFETVVADVRDDDQAPFGLTMPVTIDRRGHRSDFRLSLVLDADYETSRSCAAGKVVDVSAGGLALICADEFREGEELVIRCSLPSPSGDLHIDQRVVVRSVSMYGRTPAGTVLHQYGLKFIAEDDQLREQILSSVIWNLTRNPAAAA